ncbi:MAG: hypothetical protein Kow0090_04500 [Myxococcota bacterium]
MKERMKSVSVELKTVLLLAGMAIVACFLLSLSRSAKAEEIPQKSPLTLSDLDDKLFEEALSRSLEGFSQKLSADKISELSGSLSKAPTLVVKSPLSSK